MATVLTVVGVVAGGLLAGLGVPRLDLHGPLHHVGVMDPLCGGTRAAYLVAHGDWGGAWTYNPVVFPLVVAAALMLVRTAVGVVSGRWLTVRLADRRLRRLLVVLLTVAVVVLAVRQQMYAELLSSDWTGSAR